MTVTARSALADHQTLLPFCHDQTRSCPRLAVLIFTRQAAIAYCDSVCGSFSCTVAH
jgi:hypothetical protein